jgi:hypothetical protein
MATETTPPGPTLLQKIIATPWLVRGVAIFGVLVYLAQAWQFAHTQTSLMDEGEYLLKGLYFVRGVYTPYQDFGFWTNHMPLSFLIPGFVQAVFGPGLLTGRMYALVLNFLLVLGIWLTARRIGGRWVGAGAVWGLALNPAVIKMYSTATSQILVAAMLAWVFFFALGPGRKRWHLWLGSGLAAVLLLTRINLAPVLPLLLLYIAWEYGWKDGLRAAGVALLVVAAGHVFYWPGILRMWAAWAPPGLTPFLAPFRPPEGLPFWNPTMENTSRVLSFLFAVRYHFIALLGLLIPLLAWPGTRRWRENPRFKTAVFLWTLFLVLLLAHGWASLGVHAQTDAALGSDYCVFCFPIYTSFFSIAGILLLALAITAWPRQLRLPQQVAIAVFIPLLTTAVGYGAYRQLSISVLRWRIPRLRTLLQTGRWEPGEVALWDFLANRIGISFEESKRLVPAALGFLAGAAILLAAYLAFRWLRKRGSWSFGTAALLVLLAAGMLLSPTLVLGAGYTNYDCSGDIIAAYESAGRYLVETIPPGSAVYWQGGLSSAPLVYLDQPVLYPPQVNADYTLRLTGSQEDLLRFGFWTEAAAQEWLAGSDYALVAERYFQGWLADALNGEEFIELAPTPELAPCQEASSIRVFQRVFQP